MPFEPGHKLAPGGRRRGAGRKPEEWRRVVNRALTAAISESDVEKMFAVVAQFAMSGNVKAAQFIIERMAGKAVQPVENTGKDGGAIEHVHTLLTPEERAKRAATLLAESHTHET